MEPTRAHADNPNRTRCGATVDLNGTWTDVYFDTTRERADWLSWMDLGVRELSTRTAPATRPSSTSSASGSPRPPTDQTSGQAPANPAPTRWRPPRSPAKPSERHSMTTLATDTTTTTTTTAPGAGDGEAPGLELRRTSPGAWRIVHTGSGLHLPMPGWPTDDLPRFAAEIAAAVLTHSRVDWTRPAGELRADLDRVGTAIRDAAVIARACMPEGRQ